MGPKFVSTLGLNRAGTELCVWGRVYAGAGRGRVREMKIPGGVDMISQRSGYWVGTGTAGRLGRLGMPT